LTYSFFPSQQPPQQSQHFKKEKQLQQHDIPQHAHRTIHQRTERRIKPPIIIPAMTGHLRNVSRLSEPSAQLGIETHLQYVLAIQLSQLEKVFFALEISSVMARFPNKLSTTRSPIFLRTLRRMAVDMCGILAQCPMGLEFAVFEKFVSKPSQ
jgi:hypothetical protein